MKHRNRIKAIIAGQPTDRCGFWLGNPHDETWPLLHRHFGTSTQEQLRRKLNDDMRWICPQFYSDAYRDPRGLDLFDASLDRNKHAKPPLAGCQEIREVEDFPWPNPKYLNFDDCLRDLEEAGDVYRMRSEERRVGKEC